MGRRLRCVKSPGGGAYRCFGSAVAIEITDHDSRTTWCSESGVMLPSIACMNVRHERHSKCKGSRCRSDVHVHSCSASRIGSSPPIRNGSAIGIDPTQTSRDRVELCVTIVNCFAFIPVRFASLFASAVPRTGNADDRAGGATCMTLVGGAGSRHEPDVTDRSSFGLRPATGGCATASWYGSRHERLEGAKRRLEPRGGASNRPGKSVGEASVRLMVRDWRRRGSVARAHGFGR